MAKNDKTNVMRVLEQHKIPYEGHNYLDSGAVGGTEVATMASGFENRLQTPGSLHANSQIL